MKVLVTGSSGYIGSRLVRALSDAGHEVVGLDRRLHSYGVATDEFHHVDILDDGALDNVLHDVELVFHLAAAKDDWGLSNAEYFRDNVDATERLLDEGRKQGVRRWFFYSTVGVYGPSEAPADESAPFAATIAYGQSKAKAEMLFRSYADEHPDAEVMVIRPSAVFGPHNPANTNIYRLIDAINSGRFVMVGDGAACKTTSHLGNLIPATLFLMQRMKQGLQAYIYVDDPVMSTGELVDTLYSHIGKDRPGWHLPLGLAKPIAAVSDFIANVTGVDLPITAARIEKFCTSTVFDGSAIRRLGFEQPVSNKEALAQTVKWHLNGRAR